MGGGAILRVVKAAAAPSAGARHVATGLGIAAAAASSSSIRCFQQQQQRQQQQQAATMLSPSAAAGPSLRCGVSEDWELVDDEHLLARDHLVFGAPPSREEAMEATSDLQTVLGMCYAREPSSPVLEEGHRRSNSMCSSPRGSVLDWVEPHIISDAPGIIQVRPRSDVMEAFRLLETAPAVKDVVVSIAADTNVWEAVMNNKEVKELRKKLLQQSGAPSCQDVCLAAEDDDNNFLSQLFKYSKIALSRVQSVFSEFFSSLLKFADRAATAAGSDPSDSKTVKSCFMLGVAVVSIVVLKRAVA